MMDDVPLAAAGAADDRVTKLIELGIALSSERNRDRLLERILLEAKALTHSDGGTLYLRTDDDRLRFAIMRTDSLNIAMGGTTGKEIPIPPLGLYNAETGEPNHNNVATHVALSGETINVPDAYSYEGFDFSGTKKFDAGTGYRSKSFLTVPMKNHQGEVIGVLQLLNAQDPETGNVVPFPQDIEPIIEALASQAAVALDNQILIQAQKDLLDSFIKLIAHAIDRKSPYTGGHCERVPVLTEMLAQAACDSDLPAFDDFHLDEDEWYELHIAGWLHDCGKVTTPEYVVDKARKLETIYDRIDTVKTRFEVLKRDREIAFLRACMKPDADKTALREQLTRDFAKIEDDCAFIEKTNFGGEFMKEEDIARVHEIASQTWVDWSGAEQPFLSENEVYNLSIQRGTLTEEERKIINDHIVVTIDMLDQLPFPKQLARVPEYAGGHHEKMDGTGYPRGLTRDQMSVPARMMAVADIYEALTAGDRPYKKAKTLSESLKIMAFMCKDQHIDHELFELFLRGRVFQKYAERFLMPEQIDEVDIDTYLEIAGLKPKAPEAQRATG